MNWNRKFSRVYFVRSDIRELQQHLTLAQHAIVIGNTAVRVRLAKREVEQSVHKQGYSL
jgi:predicted solute-binding protein